jgi:hypothetical protein
MATDFAFMSTSRQRDVCIESMDTHGHNLLWEFRCTQENTVGFHSGADVSMISQYPSYNEMVFPPLTAMKVSVDTIRGGVGAVAGGGGGGGSNNDQRTRPIEAMSDRGIVEYTRIIVEPTFV